MSRIGVLIAGHGTPRSADEIYPFFKSILGSKEPSEAALNELTRRYNLINQYSLLNDITLKQFELITAKIKEFDSSIETFLAFKHISPTIVEILEKQLSKFEMIIALVLSPYFIAPGPKSYIDIKTYGAQKKIKIIKGFDDNNGFRDTLVIRINKVLTMLKNDEISKSAILFSSHSIPLSSLDTQFYENRRKQLVSYIKSRLEISIPVYIGYQSVGFSQGAWLGPTINEVVNSLKDIKNVIVVTDGFISKNSEILYDLDIDFKSYLKQRRINFIRVDTQDSSEDIIDVLSQVIISKVKFLQNS